MVLFITSKKAFLPKFQSIFRENPTCTSIIYTLSIVKKGSLAHPQRMLCKIGVSIKMGCLKWTPIFRLGMVVKKLKFISYTLTQNLSYERAIGCLKIFASTLHAQLLHIRFTSIPYFDNQQLIHIGSKIYKTTRSEFHFQMQTCEKYYHKYASL